MLNRKLVLRFLSEVAVASLLIILFARLRGVNQRAVIRRTRKPSVPPPAYGWDPAPTVSATADLPPAMPFGEERQNPDHVSDKDKLTDNTNLRIPNCKDQSLDSSLGRQDEPNTRVDNLRSGLSLPADNLTVREPFAASPASTTNVESSQDAADLRVRSSDTPQRSPSPLRDMAGTRAQTPKFGGIDSYHYTRHMGVTGFVRRRILRRDDPFELGLVCKTCHTELPKSGRCDYCE